MQVGEPDRARLHAFLAKERPLLLSVAFATLALVAWLAMGWTRTSSDALAMTLLGTQVMACTVSASFAAAYLKRASGAGGRSSVLMWLVLLGTSAWVVFLLGLFTFLRTVADD